MSKRSSFKRSRTDWKRLARMRDEDIDFSGIPEMTGEQFAKAVVRRGLPALMPKAQVTLRLDADVLA